MSLPCPTLPPTSSARPPSDTPKATSDRAGGRALVTTASYPATTTGAEPMPTNVASPTDARVTDVKNANSNTAVSAPVTTIRTHMARVHAPGCSRPMTASASNSDTPASPMRHAAMPTGSKPSCLPSSTPTTPPPPHRHAAVTAKRKSRVRIPEDARPPLSTRSPATLGRRRLPGGARRRSSHDAGTPRKADRTRRHGTGRSRAQRAPSGRSRP